MTTLTSKIERYKAYNKSRKIKAIGFNEAKATLLFKIIPYLLHCNYPDLPGFVDNPECPFGIHRFAPERMVSPELFRRHFPSSSALSVKTPSPYPHSPCIHSLQTIGSIGTIAQTEKSDCDYWISIRFGELGEAGLALFKQKCTAIEEWALGRGTEVYFFLMDIDQTRENKFESKAEEESAGSALKILLKDELFRTHILVAGKMLLWWLIPPGLTEAEYRRYVDSLVRSKKINPKNFVDLGYLSDIPKSEIFGACLWQMNKALDSPFKSVIKFAYLELLLKNKKQTLPLFSDKVKCLVTFPENRTGNGTEELGVADVDPYLLLAREIIAFYREEASEASRAELIRECLFLKTLEGMESQKKTASRTNRLAATMELMLSWRLLPDRYGYFLKSPSWRYKEIVEFGVKVHDYLIAAYKRLRRIFNTFEDETGVTITQRDIAVLGRKLFTFYKEKPYKIEYIKSLSREAIRREDITLHFARYNGDDYFYAYEGEPAGLTAGNKNDVVIKREKSPLTLITWLLVNGIIGKGTRLHLTKNHLAIELVDIQHLVKVMMQTFPPVNFSRISAAPLVQRETVVRALAVVNLTRSPVKDSKRLDATIITLNSYGEYFVEHYETLAQLKTALRLLLTKHFVSRWNNNLEIFIPPQKEQHLIQSMIFQ